MDLCVNTKVFRVEEKIDAEIKSTREGHLVTYKSLIVCEEHTFNT